MICLLYECVGVEGKELDHWLVKMNSDCGLESVFTSLLRILSAAAPDQ